MFIPANLHIIIMAVLVAAPYYFFNRYLLQKIRPKQSGKRMVGYFLLVLVTALFYAGASVILMVWYAKYRH
jgi:hypothetical protein